MAHHDIIPDIHGQLAKLEALLAELGYRRRRGRWHHPTLDRQIVFLGDFIDRGPDSGGVLGAVRELIADGRALAIMGNHELNAIHFHNVDPDTGQPLRARTDKNRAQHAGFLRQFPLGSTGAREWTEWMAGLPLWLDLGPFRAVHACWSAPAVRRLARLAPGGVLARDRLLLAGRRDDALHEDVETLTKGPEARLPAGAGFTDKENHVRHEVRLAWWRREARTWREAAISVPDPGQLPEGELPDGIAAELYPADEKPVFFGHYWLEEMPRIEAPNALCLDCSAGIGDNPLVAYAWEPGASGLAVEAIVGASGGAAPAAGAERRPVGAG
jgi:Calcineurin-like phosphoesterase